MNDERPTHGGAANMPPFPRASQTQPDRPVEPATSAAPEDESLDATEAALDAAPAAGNPTSPAGADAEVTSDAGTASDDDEIQDFDDVPLDRLEVGAEDAPDEPADEDDDVDIEEDDEPASFRSAIAAEIGRRAELSLLKGMESVADTFDETAHRIGRLAQLRGGPEALSLGPVHSTVGWLEGAADYLRSNDLEAVRSDLRQRVRQRPVQSLGIALCTGWLLGRILR